MAVWPGPRPADIPKDKEATFSDRKSAMTMWSDGKTSEEIVTATGLDAAQAHYYCKRAVEKNEKTGELRGFWVCLRNYRLKEVRHSKRNKPFAPQYADDPKGRGKKGARADCFDKYPVIEAGMKQFAFTRRVGDAAPVPIITHGILASVFLALCRQEGLDKRKEWPYDGSKRFGYKAIWEWYLDFVSDKPELAARNALGEEAAALVRKDNRGAQLTEVAASVKLAYRRIELDEHKLDGMFTVSLPARKGRPRVVFKCRRIWALVMRDVDSGAVLASGVAWGDRYTTNDVLALIYRALSPPPQLKLTFENAHYRYREGAAYPAELADFKLNGWQCLALDADSTHMTPEALAAARDVINCSIVSERIGDATARGCIEGFFPFLAQAMTWLSSATGNNAQSQFRIDPEGAAVDWNIDGTLAAEILDLHCRNWNSTATSANDGVSALQRLCEMDLEGNAFHNPIGALDSPRFWKLLPSFEAKATRRRGISGFGPLGVNLFGGRYVGPTLVKDFDLASAENKRVRVYVQQDARFAFVVPDAFPDRVHAVVLKGKYADLPHTIQWRRLSNNAAKNAAIKDRAEGPQLMFGLLQAVGEAAKRSNEATEVLSGAVNFMNLYDRNQVELVDLTIEQRAALVAYALALPDGDEDDDDDPRPGSPLPVTPAVAGAALRKSPPAAQTLPDPFGLL